MAGKRHTGGRRKADGSPPVEYSPEVWAGICAEIAAGGALSRVCRDNPKYPAADVAWRWLAARPELRVSYNDAVARRAEALAEEILEISDDGSRDYVPGPDGKMVPDHDHIARSRLRVDSRKWLAARLAPRKYGDRVELAGDAENPVQIAAFLLPRPAKTTAEWLESIKADEAAAAAKKSKG